MKEIAFIKLKLVSTDLDLSQKLYHIEIWKKKKKKMTKININVSDI